MSRPSPAVGLNEWLGRTLSCGRALCKLRWLSWSCPRAKNVTWLTIARPGRTVLGRERSGHHDQHDAEATEAGGENCLRCNRSQETDAARERAEADAEDEGLTPELSRAEGVGLNELLGAARALSGDSNQVAVEV